jgi:hypothetical protein
VSLNLMPGASGGQPGRVDGPALSDLVFGAGGAERRSNRHDEPAAAKRKRASYGANLAARPRTIAVRMDVLGRVHAENDVLRLIWSRDRRPSPPRHTGRGASLCPKTLSN